MNGPLFGERKRAGSLTVDVVLKVSSVDIVPLFALLILCPCLCSLFYVHVYAAYFMLTTDILSMYCFDKLCFAQICFVQI